MAPYRYHTLDVFTDRPFAGNPLAVFPDARGLVDAQMQAIAKELNLSETVFVLPAESAEHTRRVRIFTPGSEIPFAGHPTVGTAHLLVHLGVVPFVNGEARMVLGENVGPVPVLVREGPPAFAQLSAAQMPRRGAAAPERAALARVLSLDPADLEVEGDAPEVWSCGVPFLFVPVRDRAALARARIDASHLEAVLARRGHSEVVVFCRDPERPGSDFRARMFAPGLGIVEDPATGGAAAAFGGYVAARLAPGDGTSRWVIEQGFEMGRPSLLFLEVDRDANRLTAVRVGGHAVRMSEGVMHVHDTKDPGAS